MEFVGSIPQDLWKKVLEISKKESFPEEQPEDCPYIILKHITEKQILALTGSLKRQHTDLYLTDVFPPGEYKEHVIPEPRVKHEASMLTWQLIGKALNDFCLHHP